MSASERSAAESFKGQMVASLFLTQESMSYMTLGGDTRRTSRLQSDELEAAHTPADGIQASGGRLPGQGCRRASHEQGLETCPRWCEHIVLKQNFHGKCQASSSRDYFKQ